MLRLDSRAWAEVDLSAVTHNISQVRNLTGPSIDIMAIVKADAYGHGLVPVALRAILAGCTWLGVATVQEGATLRLAGVPSTVSIAVLAATSPMDADDIVVNDLTTMVGDDEMATALAHAGMRLGRRPDIHIDIDTGMGRSGVLPEHAVRLWQHIESAGLTASGVTTHFADADGDDEAHTRHQQREFKRALVYLRSAGAQFTWVHLDNSASTIAYRDIPCNLVRPGLLIYGIQPQTKIGTKVPTAGTAGAAFIPIPIRPVMALKARVATVRHLPAGHAISYGATHRLDRDSRVATILIGYGDGYPRSLSGRGEMLIRGVRAPILGRVCMDQTVVNVSHVPDVQTNDIAVCIGDAHLKNDNLLMNRNDTLLNSITAVEIADIIGETEHAITTGLSPRIPRIYI